jgi:hypothetical protein
VTKAPKCKLCGKAHWSYEDHATVLVTKLGPHDTWVEAIVTKVEEPVTKSVTEAKPVTNLEIVLEGTAEATQALKEVAEVTGRLARAFGRPRRYKDNAAKQRAYRERKVAT